MCYYCRTHVSSCSLQCFKSHQSDCEVALERTHKDEGVSLAAAKNRDPVSQSLEPAGSSASRPDRREDLVQMFTKYPNLRTKLRSIYEATQDPASRPESQFGDDSRFERRWSEEKGFNHGMALLQRQLESEGADSKGLKIFAAYVTADNG